MSSLFRLSKNQPLRQTFYGLKEKAGSHYTSRAETNGGRAVLRGGVKRRFLDAADVGGVELCESEALGTKVFV